MTTFHASWRDKESAKQEKLASVSRRWLAQQGTWTITTVIMSQLISALHNLHWCQTHQHHMVYVPPEPHGRKRVAQRDDFLPTVHCRRRSILSNDTINYQVMSSAWLIFCNLLQIWQPLKSLSQVDNYAVRPNWRVWPKKAGIYYINYLMTIFVQNVTKSGITY